MKDCMTCYRDGHVSLWTQDGDMAWSITHTLSAHDKSVNSVCFMEEDTSFATASDDGTVRVWKMQRSKTGTYNIR